jgi:HAD superfamily hydrolase (TIGR01509 family)
MTHAHHSLPTKAVIFDMDGLLLDSETLTYDAYVLTAKRHGISCEFTDYSRMIGLNMVEGVSVLREILPDDIDVSDFKAEWMELYRQRLDGTVPVKPGIPEIVDSLATRRVPMAVATSSQGEKARDILSRVGLARHMLAITGGNEVPRGKPAPDVYLATIAKLAAYGIRGADDCIAFEDSENGVKAARAAGLRVIQVPDLIPAARAATPPLHLIADSLATGVEWLDIQSVWPVG